MNVQSILSTKGNAVATITSAATLSDAVAALRDHGVGALVVSDDARTICGILSERDVVRAIAVHGPSSLDTAVAASMSSHVATCLAADTVDKLMAMMTERRIRHVPVVDDRGSMAGIISIGDVVKFRLDELESENANLHNYIQGRA